jgi:fatty-acyl-CoA synthase
MAAITANGSLDLDGLGTHVSQRLAAYARPAFLRIMPEIDATSTFKHRKVDLVKQGFDPAAVSEAIYLLHPELQTYVRLTPSLHADIGAGKIRL